jgi:hypothetical protein
MPFPLIPVALAAGAAYLLFGSKASASSPVTATGVPASGSGASTLPGGGSPSSGTTPSGGGGYVPPGGNIPSDDGGYGGTTLGPGGSNVPLGGAVGEGQNVGDDNSLSTYGGGGDMPAAGMSGTAAGSFYDPLSGRWY